MNKNKVDFIADLLINKKLNISNKERLFLLASEEIRKFNINDSEILGRLEGLENKINSFKIYNTPFLNSESTQRNKKQEITNQDLPKSHTDPKNTARFLKELNQNTILKSTSHLIDENLFKSLLVELDISVYNFEIHLKKIKEEYEKIADKYTANIGLKGKVKEFLFNEKGVGWSNDDIKIGWSSPEIREWCKNNIGKCPNPDADMQYAECSLIKRIKLKTGDSLNSFNEVVSHFKKQIEFRDEVYLENLISRINKEIEKENSNIIFEINSEQIQKKIRFYSDVEKVKQAYKKIILMYIKYWKESNKKETQLEIEISLNEKEIGNETIIILSIRDKLSIFGKTLLETKQKYGTDITGLIKNQINGLCDLALTAEFPNGEYAKLFLWPKGKKYKKMEVFKGVQFDLIFYRIV